MKRGTYPFAIFRDLWLLLDEDYSPGREIAAGRLEACAGERRDGARLNLLLRSAKR